MKRIVFRGELGPESPFWTGGGELINCRELGLSSEFCAELEAWVGRQWELADETPEAAAWDAEARELFMRANAALSGRYELVWDNDEH